MTTKFEEHSVLSCPKGKLVLMLDQGVFLLKFIPDNLDPEIELAYCEDGVKAAKAASAIWLALQELY
ncbi:MAG: hypothetical protein ACR2QF_03125 [Geminicoccaceae bacterium]